MEDVICSETDKYQNNKNFNKSIFHARYMNDLQEYHPSPIFHQPSLKCITTQ